MREEANPRCGAFALPGGACCWRVWAPKAGRIELVLIDGGRRDSLLMEREDGGYFRLERPGVAEGQRYAFRLDNGPERPDPASLWQPDGVHRPSAVLYPERFPWAEGAWTGIRREDLVFYELHVGTFTPEGTFDAVIPRLDSLRELGVTAVEIMPVAQFPGGRNWGYDGVHLYAVQNTYGGPHGLKRLVEACHARGLACFLDVVYNHLGPEGNYLHEFGPYFSDRHRVPWGPAFNYDGPGSDAVRQYVLDNVCLWLGDYRLDGLRLDAVHALFDTRPRHILAEVKDTADGASARVGRPTHIIAESLANDVRMVLPQAEGGYGLDAEWSDDFHHAIHAYLTGERHGKYVDYGPVQDLPRLMEQTFLLDGGYSKYRGRRWGAPTRGLPGDRFVVSVQNHDQVGNRARGERLGSLVSPPARRLAASLGLLAPHLLLLFMGEEYDETNPFLFFCSFQDGHLIENVRNGRRRDYALQGEVPDPQAESSFAASRLSWSWAGNAHREGMRRLYQDLLAVRRRWPALRDFTRRSSRLLPDEQRAAVLELVRGGPATEESLRCYFNLTAEAQVLPGVESGHVLLFSSEAERYDGGRVAGTPSAELRPYECVTFGPQTWGRLVS